MENLLLWGCRQVKPLIKDDYRVLFAFLDTFARNLWHLQRHSQKKPSPHHFGHALRAQHTALGSVLSSWCWSIAVRWTMFANTFRGTKIWSPRSGPFFYLFLFLRNTYMYVYAYIQGVWEEEGGGRGERMKIILFVVFTLFPTTETAPFSSSCCSCVAITVSTVIIR